MPFSATRRRAAARQTARRSSCPVVESLEDRRLLSTANGGRWTYPTRVTYSFMPDGTSVGGTPSALFKALNAAAPTATWQQQFQKAAAIWQAVANVNLALVPDDGSPVGGTGYQQGDSRYGDIRIGAIPQSPGILAYSLLPPPINGGSDAGDILLNSSVAWKVNTDYDLLTVAIHEIGHSLGMGHSAIQAADMYSAYVWMKQSLNSDDVAGLQGIYGASRGSFSYNNSASTAIDLTPSVNGLGQATLAGQRIGAVTEYDWFKVMVPSTTTGTMVVKMQSSALSSLAPRLAVFNGALAGLGQAVAANVYGSTVTFTVNGVAPGQVYYFRASAGNTGAGSNGGFGVQVNFGSWAQSALPSPYTTVYAQPDQGVTSSAETTSTSRSGTTGNSGTGGSTLKVSSDGSIMTLTGQTVALDIDSVGYDQLVSRVQFGTLTSWAEPLIARLGPFQRAPKQQHGGDHHEGHAHHGQGWLARVHAMANRVVNLHGPAWRRGHGRGPVG